VSGYDPFAPPTSDTSAAAEVLPPARPTGVPKTFGVLSIVFASLMLCYSLLKVLAGGMAGMMGQLQGQLGDDAGELGGAFESLARVYRALAWEGALIAVMSALLIAIGVGQLRFREWARRWTMYWSVAAFLSIGIMILIGMLVIGPAYQEAFSTIGKQAEIDAAAGIGLARMFGGTSALLSVLLYSPYPILLMIFFSRPHVRAAMTR
jgi:hypothetical protein